MQVAQSVPVTKQLHNRDTTAAVEAFLAEGGQIQQLSAKKKRKPRPYVLKQQYLPESYMPRK